MEENEIRKPIQNKFIDQTFTDQFGTLSKVARIQLYRSVKSHVIAGSKLILEIIFASEFCDPILTLVEKNELMVACVLEDGESEKLSPFICKGLIGTVCKFESYKGGSARYSFIIPLETGIYQLFLFSYAKARDIESVKDCTNDLILPLLTDKISVVTRDQMTLTPSPKALMSCYRSVDGILIEEEYGKTLGSHIYDSSIIIIRYLAQQYLRDDLNLANMEDSSKFCKKVTGSMKYFMINLIILWYFI